MASSAHEHTHAHTSCLLAAYHLSLSHGSEDIGDIQHFQEAVSFPAVKAGFFRRSKQELQWTSCHPHPPFTLYI